MTLILRFLNVGHGSSVVIEHQRATGEKHFAVVDSNTSSNKAPRALEVLHKLGAEHLSFVCLTHPHKDHYSGLFPILQRFSKNVSIFYSNPMGELMANRERFKKLGEHIAKLSKMTDGEVERKAAVEFLQILRWASADGAEWVELGGEYLELAPPGFAGVAIHSLLPPRKNVANYVSRIERGDPLMFGSVDDNGLSVALHFSYGGNSVILGGDGTVANWQHRRRYVERGGTVAAANVVNLPHHGSALDNPPEVSGQLFSGVGGQYAITSANGHSHPAIEVIERLSNAGISPYCTNLHQACGATVVRLNADPSFDPELVRMIREVSLEANIIQPCQGDITVTLKADGSMDVEPEHRNFCGYRMRPIIAA